MCGVKARAEWYLGSSLLSHVRHFKIIMQTNWQRKNGSQCVNASLFFYFICSVRPHYDNRKVDRLTKLQFVAVCCWRCFFSAMTVSPHHVNREETTCPVDQVYGSNLFVYTLTHTAHEIRRVNIVFVTVCAILLLMTMQIASGIKTQSITTK